MKKSIVLGLILTVLACSPAERGPTESASGSESERPVAIPEPDLSGLPEAIAIQIQEARDHLDELADPSEAGEAYGELGRLYHAYELTEASRACYSKAARRLPDDPRWPYLLAVLDEQEGLLDSAESLLLKVREIDPDDLPTKMRLADVLQKQGRNEDAEALFREVLEADEDNAFALFALGRIASDRGDMQEAADAFERVLELQPRATRVHYPFALALNKLGREEEAESHLELRGAVPVARDDPVFDSLTELVTGIQPILDRASAATRAKRYNEALQLYGEALAIDPNHIGALRRHANTLHMAGRLDEALVALDNLLEKHPGNVMARLEMATIRLKKGETEEGIAILRELVEEAPRLREAHANLGVALSQQGKTEEALASFEAALEVDPHYQDARFQMAKVLSEQGRKQEAAEVLAIVVEAEPMHGPARQLLGGLLLDLGDLDGARTQYLAVLEAEGVPDQERALAHFQLGLAAAREENPEEAIRHYQEALDLFPLLWQARFNLANTLMRQGRLAEAGSELETLLEGDPSNGVARARHAEILILGGDFGRAKAELEEGLRVSPGSTDVAHALARLLATAPSSDMRDGDRALELAQKVLQARSTMLHAETVAMALAEVGRFEDAVELQQRLIATAESGGAGLPVGRLKQVLALYQAGKPMRLAAPEAAGS